MPIVGMDPLLSKQLIASIQKELAANGATAPSPQALQGLCDGIAKALIPFLITNLQVAPGIAVATAGGAGATAAPGTVT